MANSAGLRGKSRKRLAVTAWKGVDVLDTLLTAKLGGLLFYLAHADPLKQGD